MKGLLPSSKKKKKGAAPNGNTEQINNDIVNPLKQWVKDL
jgi:hypothetical protein